MRDRGGAGGQGKDGGGAAAAGGGGGLSDDDKIRLQLYLDVNHYCTEAEAMRAVAPGQDLLGQLREAVAEPVKNILPANL